MTNQEKNPFIERLQNQLGQVTRPIAFIRVLGMLIVAGITVIDVLLRWLANRGIAGLTEVVAMFFAVAVAACIPSGVARGVNLKIDILKHWIVGRLGAWIGVTGAGLLLFFALLAWRIFIYAASLAQSGQITTILLWPMAPFMYGVAVLLGVAAIVQAVVFLNYFLKALVLIRRRQRRRLPPSLCPSS